MATVPAKIEKGKQLTPTQEVALSVDNIMPLIVKDEDFVIFHGRNGKQNVEPTRDLALKLLKNFNLSYDTTIEEAGEKRFIVKAVVWDEDGHKASGLGLCTFGEVYSKERREHDALTKAETRAIKRAIESLAGQAIINRLIMAVFGKEVFDDEPRNVTAEPERRPSETPVEDMDRYYEALDAALIEGIISRDEHTATKKMLEKHSGDKPYLDKFMKRLAEKRGASEDFLAANSKAEEFTHEDKADADKAFGGGDA